MLEPGSLVKGMASLRFVSAAVEIGAAVLMLRLGRLEAAVGINAALGLFGPVLFSLVSAIGLLGLAERLPLGKLLLIFGGVLLVLFGATRPNGPV